MLCDNYLCRSRSRNSGRISESPNDPLVFDISKYCVSFVLRSFFFCHCTLQCLIAKMILAEKSIQMRTSNRRRIHIPFALRIYTIFRFRYVNIFFSFRHYLEETLRFLKETFVVHELPKVFLARFADLS